MVDGALFSCLRFTIRPGVAKGSSVERVCVTGLRDLYSCICSTLQVHLQLAGVVSRALLWGLRL